MIDRFRRAVLAVCLATSAAACDIGVSTVPAPPAAASYDEYALAACGAWDALFKAVGNPDTGSGSELSRALDEAVANGDAAAAERASASMLRELAAGRVQVAVAAGWAPRAKVMAELDRVFTAFEAMTRVKLARARGASSEEPQAAFERAGGVDAWFAMLRAMQDAGAGTAPATARQCANVPVTP
jgi:hypothetical protein